MHGIGKIRQLRRVDILLCFRKLFGSTVVCYIQNWRMVVTGQLPAELLRCIVFYNTKALHYDKVEPTKDKGVYRKLWTPF